MTRKRWYTCTSLSFAHARISDFQISNGKKTKKDKKPQRGLSRWNILLARTIGMTWLKRGRWRGHERNDKMRGGRQTILHAPTERAIYISNLNWYRLSKPPWKSGQKTTGKNTNTISFFYTMNHMYVWKSQSYKRGQERKKLGKGRVIANVYECKMLKKRQKKKKCVCRSRNKYANG